MAFRKIPISHRDFVVFEQYLFSSMNLRQVGELHNVSTERVRQILFTVTRKLKAGFVPPGDPVRLIRLASMADTMVSNYWADRENNEIDYEPPHKGLRYVACRVPHLCALAASVGE